MSAGISATTTTPTDPIYVTDATSLLNIDTTDKGKSPRIVFLSTMTKTGGLITVRDYAGALFQDVSDKGLSNVVIVSTTHGIHFLNGGGPNSNIYVINQPFGFLTVSPTTSTKWAVLNSFAFPDSIQSATMNLLTVSSLIASKLTVDTMNISTATISSIVADSLAISPSNRFSVNISSSTLHYGLFSTLGAIYTGGPISTMNNLGVGGNTSILQNTSIGGTLQVGLQTTLTGNVGIGGSSNATNALLVTGTQSNTGATYLGNTLAVTSDTTIGRNLGVTGNTILQGTLKTSLGTTLTGNVGIGGSSNATNTLLVTGTQSNTDNVGIGGTLSVAGNTTLQGTLTASQGTSLLTNVGIGGASNATDALIVRGTQATTGAVGIGGSVTVVGNTTLQGSLSVEQGTTILGNVRIGSGSASTDKLVVNGSETITENLYIRGNFSIGGTSLNLPTTYITDSLTVNGVLVKAASIKHDYWTEPTFNFRPYIITPKSKKCSVTIVAGGGGGGAGCSGYQGSGGGGGGGSGFRTSFIVEFSDLAGAEFRFSVGYGGSGGVNAWGNVGFNGDTWIGYNWSANGTSYSGTNGESTYFRTVGGTLLNNGLGGTTPVTITVAGGRYGSNAQAGNNAGYGNQGGRGFCGGGVGSYDGHGNSANGPGKGFIISQDGGALNVNSTFFNGIYARVGGQGGNITGLPMSEISQIPEWNLTSLANYNQTNGSGYQGFGAPHGGGGGGGPGGGNGGTYRIYRINTESGMYINEPFAINDSIPYSTSAAQTYPGYAGSPGILGGGGGGGSGPSTNQWPGNGGKGGDGYVEITWL